MSTPKEIIFQQFRYQILPIRREFQMNFLHPEITSMEALLQKKNEYFAEALRSIDSFIFSQTSITKGQLYENGNKFVFKIGARRSVELEKPDFSREEVDNWPSLVVVVDNDEATQIIYIEKNKKAFQHPDTVAGVIEDNINSRLINLQLQCHIKPMFETADFWATVHRYQNNISMANFELITPNLPNISDSLIDDLKKTQKQTNSAVANLQFQSDPNGSLALRDDDPVINGLVKYASDGGGNITLKIKNRRSKIQTKNSSKNVSIGEIEIQGVSEAEVLRILEQVLRLQ